MRIILAVLVISLTAFFWKENPKTENTTIKTGYLDFTFTPENRFYNPEVADTHFVYTQIKADAYNPVSTRLPLNLSLVIDRSGSMAGDKLKYAKEAAVFLVSQLKPEDYVSIVIYDTDVKLLQKSTSAINKTLIISAINSISSGSSTNLSGGLIEGYDQVRVQNKAGYVNRVLLMSDGLANAGITDPMQIKQLAQQANLKEGISTSTFGIGADFNEDLMMGISESGSGNYYFIQNPDQIPDIFKKELNGLLSVVAQNVKINIELPENVQLIKLFGYENQTTDSNKIQVNVRDIASEEIKSFLFSYVIKSGTHKSLHFQSSLQYIDAIAGSAAQQTTLEFQVNPTSDVQIIEENLNAQVISEYAIFYSNWLMTNAMQMVENGNYNGARLMLDGNNTLKFKYGSYIKNDSNFAKQDTIMLRYKSKTYEYEKMNDYDKKVLQKSNKAMNYSIQKKK